MNRILLNTLLIAGLLFAALIVSRWPASRPETPASAVAAAPAAPAPTAGTDPAGASALGSPLDQPVPVSPLALLQEFMGNSYLAGQKYNGRVVYVAGVVTAVEPGRNEVAYLQLSLGPKRVDTMQALFQKNAAQIIRLKAGDQITISGSPRYDGDLESVMLNDCVLVQ